jgi:citrate lyase subunit beta/citryl-CoA lyase
MQVDYLMRSLMFVPAHNDKLMDSATRSYADVLLLDLEDSCLPNKNKQVARDKIVSYIQSGRFNNKIVIPRVNERSSGELLKDVYQLCIHGIDGFMYPKANSSEDVYFFGKLLETIEYEKNIPIGTFKIIPLIETAGAIMNIQKICESCINRVIAVAFGHLDYILDIHGQYSESEENFFVARTLVVTGARAAGVIPIDTIHPHKVHDLIDLERRLKTGKELGYEGMLALNPKELPLIHQYYSPTKEEVEWATDIIMLSNEAVKDGKGVALKDGQFIGPPIVKLAKTILVKNKLINDRK